MIETGSSLLYPLFNLWIPEYVKAHAGLEITPQSTGSGTGISQAIDGTAQIGGSDAYLSPALAKQHATMMNIRWRFPARWSTTISQVWTKPI